MESYVASEASFLDSEFAIFSSDDETLQVNMKIPDHTATRTTVSKISDILVFLSEMSFAEHCRILCESVRFAAGLLGINSFNAQPKTPARVIGTKQLR